MVDVHAVNCRLAQAAHSVRAAMRSLGGGRESQDSSHKAILAMSEILDLLYQIREQLSSEEKWAIAQARLNSLDELLSSFEITIATMEINFQPGGVGSRVYRKGLLEQTFIQRLEQYRMAFLVAMQPDSREKVAMEHQLRTSIRTFRDLEPEWLRQNPSCGEDFHCITSPVTSRNLMRFTGMCNRREQGTCQWIFQEESYKAWLFGSYRTLYFIGPAGSGKTFMAASVTENLRNTFALSDVAVVFLFCEDEKEDSPRSSISMLENFLAQLVHRRGAASHTTAALYESEEFLRGQASAKAYQSAIRAEVNHFSKVFVIIDGLDLFGEKDRILNRFHKLPEHAQLLITLREARHEKDVCIPIRASQRDLETYIDARLGRDSGLTALLEQYPPEYELRDAVIAQVALRSRGLFLLAQLHMDLLSRCPDASVLQTTLLHLPNTLNDAYAESMKQLASHNLHASRCISWTLYAYRPLTVAELEYAVFFEPQNGAAQKQPSSFEHILYVETAGILIVDQITTTVHLVHRTAKEYLTGAAARVFFPTARKHIAETCLTVIASDEVVDDFYLNHRATPKVSNSSLLAYAATYWGDHVRELPEEEQTTQVLIGTFLNKLCWRRPPIYEDYSEDDTDIFPELGLARYYPDWSALHVLAYFGITTKAKRLIEKGADVNANDNALGLTPLHCAAHRGHEEMVELLLDNKANINATSNEGYTAMHLAAEQGQRRIMRLLLSRRANSRTANRKGVTALHLAVGTALDEATVPLLIKSRSDMDAQNALTGNTTLHIAIELRRPRVLLFLLEKGANLNIFNKQGLTPLQLAAKLDNCEALTMLLEKGSKVDFCSLSGLTALHIAAMENNWIAFDILMVGGADINTWDEDGETLLHKQARQASSSTVASHLLEQGANIEARTSQGYTPLQCAAMDGNKKMFFFLLENGAKVDVETPKGETLLHITPPSSQDCLDILMTLLNMELDVSAISINGWTPLHQTVIMGTGAPDIEFDKTSEYIDLLLSHGADINAAAESPKGEAPLHLAVIATMQRPSLVSYLVSRGASVNCTTSEGKTPLHLAAERGRNSIFQALLAAGADLTIKVPNPTTDDEEDSDEGDTPLDIARKHPLGAHWFDETGNLQLAVNGSHCGSLATPIEELDTDSESDDGTHRSTSAPVGDGESQWGSVISTQVASTLSEA
ncbi:hypothetical protein ABHI18_002599 [Aspergillus niger]